GKLVLRASSLHRERGRELAGQFVVLDGGDFPKAPALTIAHPGDLVVRGSSGLSGAHEVCVQRMTDPPWREGGASGGERLREKLSPEHARALAGVGRRCAGEQALAAIL